MYRLEIYTDKSYPIILEIEVSTDDEARRKAEELMELFTTIKVIRIYKCKISYYNMLNISRR